MWTLERHSLYVLEAVHIEIQTVIMEKKHEILSVSKSFAWYQMYVHIKACLSRIYVGNSKINLQLVGKKKCFVVVPKRMLNSNKCLLLLNAYPHIFSLRSVGVITDETWTLSSPLLPAVRYVFWNRKGILLTEFTAPGTTITSEVYCETLNKLQRLIQKNGVGCSLKASFSCTTTRGPTPRLTQML